MKIHFHLSTQHRDTCVPNLMISLCYGNKIHKIIRNMKIEISHEYARFNKCHLLQPQVGIIKTFNDKPTK